jgi:hypothetical protein
VLPQLAVAGEYYYVNTYSTYNAVIPTSAIYKIDISSKKVIDSLFLNIHGEFVIARPLEINIDNHHLLLSFLSCGLVGKNSMLDSIETAVCVIIDKSDFRILAINNMPYYFFYDDLQVSGDTIYDDWMDNSPDSSGCFHGCFHLDSNDYSLRIIERVPYREEFDKPVMVGKFSNPVFLIDSGTIKYYLALRDGLELVVFKADSINNVLNEKTVGNRANSAVVGGFNPLDSLIYIFTLRYYLETQVPPISSPDSIFNTLRRLRLSDFQEVGKSVNIEQLSFIANEAGNAEFIDGSFVYYFSEGEGYGTFEPAMLFIFDTRTNEATWLRVGWR